MKYPILVNIFQPTIQEGKQTSQITRGVYDFYYENIVGFQHMADNSIVVTFYNPPVSINIGITFDNMMSIIGEQIYIDDRFKEEVESYKKNNFESFIERIIRNRDNGEES